MTEVPHNSTSDEDKPKPAAQRSVGARVRTRVLFFIVAWAIVLLPFYFWRSTWFGRQLSNPQIGEYLRDEGKPRHIQHALVQLGERMARKDASATQFYPELVRLRTHRLEEIRNTDAWVMGQDNTRPEFHRALQEMLHDPAPMVRANAALALVRFGDQSGRTELVRMLAPATIAAPESGRIVDFASPGTAIRQGGMVAKIEADGNTVELRSPINGRVRSLNVQKDATVTGGSELAVLDPSAEQVREALRGLYFIGEKDDLPAVRAYRHATPEMPDQVRQQAVSTEQAILGRSDSAAR